MHSSNGNTSGLNNSEMARYARHFAIPEFGVEGQKRLKAASVLVVGAGGLGCPMLQYLAAAGVGKIGIVDDDVIDPSNLHRQILYGDKDVGKHKAAVAKEKLQAINPHIHIEAYLTRFDEDNAFTLMEGYDIIADGTDNFPTRYLVNDACVLANKINVYGSIFRFEGQVSVFNYLNENGERGPNYRDVFPDPPPPGLVPNCAEAGVLGVLPGIIGSLQASEAIKVITGIGEPLVGRLFLFDAASFSARTLKIAKNPALEITKLETLPEYCEPVDQDQLPSIEVGELKQMFDKEEDFQLVDVRKPYEFEINNLSGDLIPLDELEFEIEHISKDKPVVVHCKSGARSRKAVEILRDRYGFNNVINLEGGIEAWERAYP